MPTKKISPGVTRFDLDDRNSHGYMVRICRQKQHFNEFFSDSKHGGKAKAKKAAVARYEELLEQLGPAVLSTKNRLTKRNMTGRVGVHVSSGVDSRWPNCEYSAYCASWVAEDGTRKKINFSWNKYGQKKAWKLACIARDHETNDREMVLQLFGKLPKERSVKKKASSRSARRK